MYDFVVRAWPVIFPNEPYVDGKHIALLCAALERCYNGEIRNLIINIPFRHMKSLLVNVFLPAWVWTKSPQKKFICTSAIENNVVRDSLLCRDLVSSDWYCERFGELLRTDRNTTVMYKTIAGGHRYAVTMGGGIIGEGGDWVLTDDPQKASEIYSDKIREKSNQDYRDAVSTRVTPDGCRIIIMQRLHHADLSGEMQKNGTYKLICLPVEYEGERYRFDDFTELNDWRTDEGEALWPERFGPEWIAEQKNELTAKGVAGQLQQRPAPLEGAIYKRDWFTNRYIPREVEVIARYISWDTANVATETAAYSSGIVLDLLVDYRVFVRFVSRKRMEFPQLEHEVTALSGRYMDKLKNIVIEYKASGVQVVQSLKQTADESISKLVTPFKPQGDKIVRGHEASKWAEKQMVVFPPPSDEFPWLYDFEEEIFNAPNTEFMDQFDSLNQGILYLRNYLQQGLRR